jgi:hypothetical protein
MRVSARLGAVFLVCGALALGACSDDARDEENATAQELNPLASLMVPPPSAFAVSTAPDVVNGPLDAAGFDDYLGVPGTASRTGLQHAYTTTFDSTENEDTAILVVIAEFATEQNANTFRNQVRKDEAPFRAQRGAPIYAPRIRRLAGVPGGTLITPTEPDEVEGTYDHAAVGTKGKRAFFIDYLTRRRAPASELPPLAREQYARL